MPDGPGRRPEGRRGAAAAEYLQTVIERAHEPMQPDDWTPDLGDRPRTEKVYRDLEHVPLPTAPPYPVGATIEQAMFGGPAEPVPPRPFDLGLLAGMLRESYGLTGRRLGVNPNPDFGSRLVHEYAVWSRGTASAGGRYPISVYWLHGGGSRPGIYHYRPSGDAFDVLALGDPTGHVRPGERGQDFLVLGSRLWHSTFKYAEFGYHTLAMEVGTLLQTWRTWCTPLSLPVLAQLRFDERRLAEALGLDPAEEAMLAVLALPWQQNTTQQQNSAGVATVRARYDERSRRVLSFHRVPRLQHAMLAEADDARDATGPVFIPPAYRAPAAPPDIVLPVHTRASLGVPAALRRRRSSFGRLAATGCLQAGELSTLLAAAAHGRDLPSDYAPDGLGDIVATHVVAQRVAAVPAGHYTWNPRTHGLNRKGAVDVDTLQRRFFIANYSLVHAAAIIVVTARARPVLDRIGDHGYRLLALAVGAATQAVYTAAAAIDVGVGAALGFDNVDYAAALGLPDGEDAMIILLVGPERPGDAEHRFSLTADPPDSR